MRASNKPGRLPALDGLRGVAVLAVMLYHFAMSMSGRGPLDGTTKAVLRMGWAGVDLFLVLSGFLITGILLDTKGAPWYWRSFLWRRTLRIFPLYIVSLAGLSLVGHFVLTAPGVTDHEWMLWTYVTNLGVAVGGSWEAVPFYGIHFWSLAVEEQFYLVWPLIVLVCSPRTLRWVCVSTVVGALCLRTGLVLGGVAPVAVYVLTVTRSDALAAGALLALAVRDDRLLQTVQRWSRTALPVSAAGLVALALLRRGLDNLDGPVQTIGFSLFAMLSAGLVLRGATASGESRFASAMCRPWLMALGKYSYALYIVHFPVRIVMDRLLVPRLTAPIYGTELPGRTLYMAAGIALSLGFAWTSWQILERQCLRLKDWVPPDPKFAVSREACGLPASS